MLTFPLKKFINSYLKNVSCPSSNSLNIFQPVFFPLQWKHETVAQLVNECQNDILLQIFAPKIFEHSRMGMYFLALPTPNSIQSSSKFIAVKCRIAMTATSVSTVTIEVLQSFSFFFPISVYYIN